MRDLDHPTPRRMSLLCSELFDPRAHVGDITAATDCLLSWITAKGSVGAQMLSSVGSAARPTSHNGIKYRFELRNVMMIGRGHDDRQRDATGVHQEAAFAPIFFPDRWSWASAITQKRP